MKTRPHATLLASPGMGHLIPVVELANRLVAEHGFYVTVFVVTTDASLSLSKLFNDLNVQDLNVVILPPVDISALVTLSTGILTQLAMMMREALPSLRSAILDMKVCPTVLIVDLFGTEAFAVADEFKMMKYVFITSTAWFLALTVHLPSLDKVVNGELVQNQEPMSIPGCMAIPAEDTFEPILDRQDQMYSEYLRMGIEIPTANGILVNTWQDLEATTLRALVDKNKLGKETRVPVFPVGPLIRSVKPYADSNLMSWLDMQPDNSVLYVSFGSGGTLSAKQTTELAWGLEMSQQRFVWVVRPPIENDTAAAVFETGYRSDDTPNFLPDGFLTRTKGTGLVVPLWAPQTEILSRPSVGGFLSHCGWNSTLESMMNGVPMIAWPLYAEQGMNATMLTEDIGIASRSKVLPSKEVINRDEIETMVRSLLEETGNARREKAMILKSSAEKALRKGGSSYNSLRRLANDCMSIC